MDRKLIDYLPPVLREVMEFQSINGACEPEFTRAWDSLALVFANQFLDTADESGVRMWEKELKIYPKDTDTLNERKIRIKAMWNMELPYTLTWLRNWVAGMCKGSESSVSVENYMINVQFDATGMENANSIITEIINQLLKIRPANMEITVAADVTGASQHYSALTAGVFIEVYASDAIHGESQRYSALTGGAMVEIYGTTAGG
jgi:hypothetical protein